MAKIIIVDPIGIHSGMKYYTDAYIRLLQETGYTNVGVASNFNYNGKSPFLPFLYSGNALAKISKLGWSCVKLFFKTLFSRKPWYIVYSYGTLIDFCFMMSMMFSKHRIMDVHEVVQQATMENQRLKKMFAFAYRFVDIAIVHSDKSRDMLAEIGYKGKILSVPHFEYNMDAVYDLNKVGEDVSAALKSERKNVLFFGNLTYNKGVDILVSNTLQLTEDIKSKLNIIVAGKAIDDTLESCRQDDDAITYIIRHINDDEMKYLYKNSDYIALPYRLTYQSGVLEMAFNYETPVIVSDIPYFASVLQRFPSFGVVSSIDNTEFQKTLCDISNMSNKDFYSEKDVYNYHHKEEVVRFMDELKKIIV